MSNEELLVDEAPAEHRVAQQLLAAREKLGMTLDQVAAKTRITMRHLQLIESGNFGQLPGRTYAVGFAKNYARVVGLDEDDVAELVRDEFEATVQERQPFDRGESFEPGDPGKVPSKGLAWLTAIAALLLVAGAVAVYSTYFRTGSGPASLLEESAALLASEDDAAGGDAAAAEDDAAVPQGDVVFTALEDGTWVKFYDADGTRLLEKQLALNESWTVPSDVNGPQIRTGRPHALAITIGGRPVPKLSEEVRVISDVPVDAKALLARDNPPSDTVEE